MIRWTGAEIQAVLKGAERLEGPWAEVPEDGETAFRLVTTERNGGGLMGVEEA